MKITVDLISDVICPWCYIGKRRLEKAITAINGRHKVHVHWHPFQLNPMMPKEGISRKEYRIRKFGSWEKSLELDARVIAVGESEGIRFAFDKMKRTPNTVDAHRVVWLAAQYECQDAVVEALFRAYFTEGQDISDRQTLVEVVTAAGLDRQATDAMLNSDDGTAAILEGKEMSQQHGVTGVPFLIIDQKIALSGAQPAETILAAFERVMDWHPRPSGQEPRT